MPRADFYVLQGHLQQERLQFAARLTEKAWLQTCTVALLMEDEASARALDELLWQLKPESFLPHGRDHKDPLLICTDASGVPTRDLLINLSSALPSEPDRFPRHAEVVIQTPDVLEQTRKRFGQYREMSYNLNTHKL